MTTTYIGPLLELQICLIQVQKSITDRLTSGQSPEVLYFSRTKQNNGRKENSRWHALF